jgi:hypothetical protein
MSIETKVIVENGIAINIIIVDTTNLPVLPEGQTLEDPAEYPYNPED